MAAQPSLAAQHTHYPHSSAAQHIHYPHKVWLHKTFTTHSVAAHHMVHHHSPPTQCGCRCRPVRMAGCAQQLYRGPGMQSTKCACPTCKPQ
eukprot:1139454-Pelagomonas_calceolata.AAC.8